MQRMRRADRVDQNDGKREENAGERGSGAGTDEPGDGQLYPDRRRRDHGLQDRGHIRRLSGRERGGGIRKPFCNMSAGKSLQAEVTVMVKEPIKLRQLVDYFLDDSTNIQITFSDQEWDEYEQVSINSRLLNPYMDSIIECMGFEEAIDIKGENVLRVTIKV